MPGRRVTQHQRAQMRAMRRGGWSLSQIEAEMEVSIPTIIRHVRDIPVAHSRTGAGPQVDRDKMFRLRAQGLTWAVIAERLRCHPHTPKAIAWRARKSGLIGEAP